MSKLLLWVPVAAILCCSVAAEKVSGTVNLADSKGFAFLGKFCFDYKASSNFSSHHSAEAGSVEVELTNTGERGSEYTLFMYDDQANSWPKIFDSDLSCAEKTTKELYTRAWRTFGLKRDATQLVRMPIKQHIRPRWWWLYIANCEAYETQATRKNLTSIDFSLHFVQNKTSWLSIEVSANDSGLNIMYSVYLMVYVVLFGVQLYAYYVYTIQQYIHQVIKLLTASVCLQLLAVAFHFADWFILTQTGQHELFFPVCACVTEALSASVFLLLLLVLAQGWTVSRFEVMYPRLLLASVVSVALIQITLFVWALVGLDQESTRYAYDSIPQWIYGIAFALFGLVFIASCVCSYRNEAANRVEQRKLYLSICALFSTWFLWPLVRIIVGQFLFKPWNRDIAIQSISLTIHTITYFVMMLLMWPSNAPKYFNLTMIDTQQRILDVDAGAMDVTKKPSDYKVLQQDRL